MRNSTRRGWLVGLLVFTGLFATTLVASAQTRPPEEIKEHEDGTSIRIEKTIDGWTVTDLLNGTPVATRFATERETLGFENRALAKDQEFQVASLKAELQVLREAIAADRGGLNPLEVSDALVNLIDLLLIVEGP